jgi:hypothetical protein
MRVTYHHQNTLKLIYNLPLQQILAENKSLMDYVQNTYAISVSESLSKYNG